jgi:phage/conjugal plasmid C-4 type zinc finger TraR family protein
MAGGWSKDGAVGEQIEASIQDELARMRAQRGPVGESLTHCAECEEPIPEARRSALPGVKVCIDCASERSRKAGVARRHQPPRVEGQSTQVTGRSSRTHPRHQ